MTLETPFNLYHALPAVLTLISMKDSHILKRVTSGDTVVRCFIVSVLSDEQLVLLRVKVNDDDGC